MQFELLTLPLDYKRDALTRLSYGSVIIAHPDPLHCSSQSGFRVEIKNLIIVTSLHEMTLKVLGNNSQDKTPVNRDFSKL